MDSCKKEGAKYGKKHAIFIKIGGQKMARARELAWVWDGRIKQRVCVQACHGTTPSAGDKISRGGLNRARSTDKGRGPSTNEEFHGSAG